MPKTPEEYLKEPYSRVLIPDEGGGYSAEMFEFPGCVAEGATADEAMQALERAAASWIQAALDQDQDIPQPFMNQGYSGRVALRLPKSLHRKALQCAEREGTSLNQCLVSAVGAWIGAEECYSRLIRQLAEKGRSFLDTEIVRLSERSKEIERSLRSCPTTLIVASKVMISLDF